MVTLADIILAAQQKSDQQNSNFIDNTNAVFSTSQTEWLWMANHSAGDLYDLITNTNQDWNIAPPFAFTLAGNTFSTNFLDVTTLPSLGAPAYFKLRGVELNSPNSLGTDPWVPLRKVPSVQERHKYNRTVINPYFGVPICSYFDWGNKVEILPAIASAGTYQLLYIPQLPVFKATDTLDGYWLSVNGWDEYIALDVAMKAAMKEESFDMAQGLNMQKQEIKAAIIKSASARNASEPQRIADVTSSAYYSLGNGFFGGGDGFGGW